jgi:serine/threonine protein kinase
VEEAVRDLLQAADGLAYAHQQGVCHRDIKPGNLMVDSSGMVKVVGFGMAHIEADSAVGTVGHEGLTQQGQVLGTYDYMSPEQAFDSRRVDPRCDVYSLGCTLHALLVGRPPYPGKSVVAQLTAHQGSPIPFLRMARPDVPEWLDRVFEKMLAKRPEDRWQSMDEVIAALDADATGQQASPAATGGSSVEEVTGVSPSADEAGGPAVEDEAAASPAPAPSQEKKALQRLSIGTVLIGAALAGLVLALLAWGFWLGVRGKPSSDPSTPGVGQGQIRSAEAVKEEAVPAPVSKTKG